MLAFERAKLYSPRFADLNHNLAVIRGQFLADQDLVKAPEGVRGAMERMVGALSENEWTMLASLLFWLMAGALWLRFMLAHPLARLFSLYGFLTLGFAWLGVGYLCAAKLHENRPGTRAIVLASELAAQQSPGGRQNTLFRLHAGAEVRVADRRGEWLFIRLPNGAAAWAPQESLGFVRPKEGNIAKAFVLTQPMGGKEKQHGDGNQEKGGHSTALGPRAGEAPGGQ